MPESDGISDIELIENEIIDNTITLKACTEDKALASTPHTKNDIPSNLNTTLLPNISIDNADDNVSDKTNKFTLTKQVQDELTESDLIMLENNSIPGSHTKMKRTDLRMIISGLNKNIDPVSFIYK